jgi:predicted enzyme related to lactoylglutathione lyase
MMDKVKGFGIPVDDIGRASKFYEGIFGWEVRKVPGSGGDFLSVRTVPVDDDGEPTIPGGINGGLYLRGTHGLMNPFLKIVDSIDSVIERIIAAGGEIVKDRSPISDITFFAVVKDTEATI